MRFKKILVSDDNQLVLSDYGLNEGDVEIIDLNKSLHDVANDPELREFIMQNIIDNDKIYIVCVKEDFGTNDQLLEDIDDIKVINKTINKAFKKVKNIYFFVYNTFLKNDSAINPTLGKSVEENDAKIEESQNEAPENVQLNSPEQEEAINFDEFKEADTQQIEHENVEEEIIDASTDGNVEQETVIDASHEGTHEVELTSEEGTDTIVEINNEIVSEDSNPEITEDEMEKLVDNGGVAVATLHSDENPSSMDSGILNDEQELEQIFHELDNIDTKQDELIKKDIEQNNEVENLIPTTSDEIFDEKEYGEVEEIPTSPVVNLDSVDSVALENQLATQQDDVVYENRIDDSVDMPQSYFDTTSEDEISYEDYNEFVNDYELGVHALKSIYDFIWRLLVLNNQSIKLNDLLYISVNNLEAFSIGQSDFVRQVANKAESLFDLILQLDVKLEFNNSLFYIYLAQFFTIRGNKIKVNNKFLDTLSVWIDKAAKKRFVEQVEQFMNYSSIYNKKIIYSYFIELANFIKGCLPSINANIALIDIHRILINKLPKIRNENVFAIIAEKMNSIFVENEIIPEMNLVDTPENMFGEEQNSNLDENSDSWKTQLTVLYKKFIENILNYIMLKGNNETEIFNLYVDIKDLRLYNDLDLDTNILSPDVTGAISNKRIPFAYGTIGDALERDNNIVSTQISHDESLNAQFLNAVEKGINNVPSDNSALIETSTNVNEYPSNLTIENQSSNSLENLRSRYATKFNMTEFENAMSRRIEEYEKKIKDNIARIEAERRQLRQKMEDLKNI